MRKVILAALFLVILTFSGCGSTEVNLALLSYADKNIEDQPSENERYITVEQLVSLLRELGVKFDDYTSGIHVLPFDQKGVDIPREYDLYGYWVSVAEDELFGFQFQASDEWGAYTVVVMQYNAEVDIVSNTFDINELKSVRIGSYHIAPDSSLVLVFKGMTEDFETPFSTYDEIETWLVQKSDNGFTLTSDNNEIELLPVKDMPFTE